MNLKQRIGNFVGLNPVRWAASTRAILQLARESIAWNARQPSAQTPAHTLGIVVNVWLATWVPWYSIVMGLVLSTRGNKVVFIFDDAQFGDAPVGSAFIRWQIARVLRVLRSRHEVILVSRVDADPGALDASARDAIARLAELNAVHKLRGETIPTGRAAYTALVTRQLSAAWPAVHALTTRHAFDAIVVPGGVYGTSGLWVHAGQRGGVRVTSFDAGAGVVLMATRGVAAQLRDIPRAYRQLQTAERMAGEREQMVMRAQAEIEKRRGGRSAFNYQHAPPQASDAVERYRGAVLIALNSSWDQAALGLHVVFKNSADWILESVRWILEHSDAKVVVRQHPSERFALTGTTDDYASLLEKAFGHHDRLHFVGAADPVNTYDLLAVSSCVLTYTSTLGVEATALRKPTIVASDCYYADLGFVWSARDRATYFAHLSSGTSNRLSVSDEQQRDALVCYYSTQVCNWIFTKFNPVGDDFFSHTTFEQLRAWPDVDLVLQVIETDTPVAILNHRRLSSESFAAAH